MSRIKGKGHRQDLAQPRAGQDSQPAGAHPDTHGVEAFCWWDYAVSRKALRSIYSFIPGEKEDEW